MCAFQIKEINILKHHLCPKVYGTYVKLLFHIWDTPGEKGTTCNIHTN